MKYWVGEKIIKKYFLWFFSPNLFPFYITELNILESIELKFKYWVGEKFFLNTFEKKSIKTENLFLNLFFSTLLYTELHSIPTGYPFSGFKIIDLIYSLQCYPRRLIKWRHALGKYAARISCFGDINLPPGSCYLTPLEIFFFCEATPKANILSFEIITSSGDILIHTHTNTMCMSVFIVFKRVEKKKKHFFLFYF